MIFRYEQEDVIYCAPIFDGNEWHSFVAFSDGAIYCGHNDVNLNEPAMILVPVGDDLGYGIFIPAPEILN